MAQINLSCAVLLAAVLWVLLGVEGESHAADGRLAHCSRPARPTRPPPVRRVQHPTRSTLRVLPRPHAPSLTPAPRTLRHDDALVLSLSLPAGPDVALVLSPSRHLLHPRARTTVGDDVAPLARDDWRAYTGEVVRLAWAGRAWAEEAAGGAGGAVRPSWRAAAIGSAAVMVHDAGADDVVWEGTFDVGGVGYHVLTREHYERVRSPHDVALAGEDELVVFSDHDRWHDGSEGEPAPACAHDRLPFNAGHLGHLDSALGRRDDIEGSTQSTNYISSINSTAGCPGATQILYMGVAADCAYVSTYGSAEAARTAILNDWNAVSALYKRTFNVAVGIIEIVVPSATCPNTTAGEAASPAWNVGCDATGYTLDARLSDFSTWRAQRAGDGAGLWHLMSACPTDTEVGVAWLGQLCVDSATESGGQYVSGTAISTATTTEWSLISHEIGHGFGAIHDCTSACSLSGSCCPHSAHSCDAGGGFIMNPTTSTSEKAFSACTLGNICTALGSTLNTTCLATPGAETVLAMNQCGNGIVEDGEECDPGSNSTSTCCDVSTCKLVPGAVCDSANSACCTPTCAYAGAGTVCRAAADAVCDLAEVCTGGNATCPADITTADGTGCGTDGEACASGQCTSLDLQCRVKGGGLNLTKSCEQKDATSCIVTCEDPSNSDQCLVLQTPLIDGSPCGYGGHCYNSTCVAGSQSAEVAAWYRANLNVSVPVTVFSSMIALALLAVGGRFLYYRLTGRPAPRRRRRRRVPTRPRRPRTATPPDMAQLPHPPALRHSDSVTSTDPLAHTAVPARDPSPRPPAAAALAPRRATLAASAPHAQAAGQSELAETVAAHRAYAEAYAATYGAHAGFDRRGFEDYVNWVSAYAAHVDAGSDAGGVSAQSGERRPASATRQAIPAGRARDGRRQRPPLAVAGAADRRTMADLPRRQRAQPSMAARAQSAYAPSTE